MNIENLELEYKILAEELGSLDESVPEYRKLQKAIAICEQLLRHISYLEEKPLLDKIIRSMRNISHDIDTAIYDLEDVSK
jgi:hypothetical protein